MNCSYLGRIYSKFGESKLYALTEVGIHNLLTLFLTLATIVGVQEIVSKTIKCINCCQNQLINMVVFFKGTTSSHDFTSIATRQIVATATKLFDERTHGNVDCVFATRNQRAQLCKSAIGTSEQIEFG